VARPSSAPASGCITTDWRRQLEHARSRRASHGVRLYSGTTTVSAGTLQLNYVGGSVPAPNSTAASIASGATLAYFLASGSGFQNIAAAISGSGTLRFDQAGGLTFNVGGLRLAGTNSFSGTIEIGENASLAANSAGALQGKPAVVFTGSVGRLALADTASGAVIGSLSGAAGSIDGGSGTINTPRSLTIEQNSTSSFGGSIVDGSNGRTISLTKLGSGTLTLTGNNTYTGGTTIGGGRLEIAPAGQLAAGGAITINGATADLRYNASTPLTAPLTFTQGTISGTGTIGTAVTVAAGRILAPGNSPGAQAYTSGLTWSPSGSYQWEINDANGVVATNWDVLNVSGSGLNLTGLSSESRFNLDLITLSGTASGLMANYIDGQSYSFAIATYSSLALPTGFTDTDLTSLFQLNTSGWLNPLPAPGNFMVINDADANTINLVIVPEPAGLALAGLGSVAAAWALRRRPGRRVRRQTARPRRCRTLRRPP
jgi:fibronectin-binding autotransporter adhesin